MVLAKELVDKLKKIEDFDMEQYNKKSISDDLKIYDHLAKDSDFIEITEWHNGEGWDIAINERIISLTWGQLEAINYLIKSLEYRS